MCTAFGLLMWPVVGSDPAAWSGLGTAAMVQTLLGLYERHVWQSERHLWRAAAAV